MRLKTLGLLLVLFVTAGTLLAQNAAPWIGTWKLNPTKSSFTDANGRSRDTPWQDRTFTFEPVEGGMKVVDELTPVKGRAIRHEYVVPYDGSEVSLEEVLPGFTVAFRRVDDRTFELVTSGGEASIVDRFQITADGGTLNHHVVGVETTKGGYDRAEAMP